jgi:hypothetical protein
MRAKGWSQPKSGVGQGRLPGAPKYAWLAIDCHRIMRKLTRVIGL